MIICIYYSRRSGMEKIKRIKDYTAEITFGILLLGVALLYLSRINMGMAEMDESFYLTIPLRLAQGDALLVDEWHVSQLAGFLTYPLMKVYLWVTGGKTEGIVLHFRYIYLLIQMAVTVAGYMCLRKREKWMAVIVSLVYALFTPFGIKALSYNTMGLMATYLFVVLGLTAFRRDWLKYVLMGVLLAAAVLCNPYMVVLYGILAVAAFVAWIFVRGKLPWKRFLWLTLGAGVLFILFMGVELSRVTVSQILDSFQFVAGDAAHKSKGFWAVFNSFRYYLREYPGYFWWWLIGVLTGLTVRKSSPVCFAVISIASIKLTLHFALDLTNGIGYSAMMIPLSFTGLAAFLLSEKRRWSLLGGWAIGFLYCLCMSASSNNGIYTFANASTVGACVGLLMIYDFLAGQLEGKALNQLAAVAMVMLIGVQFSAESYVLLNHIFWESGPKALTTKVEGGHLDGVYTTPGKAKKYQTNLENIASLKEYEGDHVLFYCRFPGGYLIMNDWSNGANSAWLADSVKDLNDARMDEYAKRHPEKTPDVIYVDADSKGVWSDEQWADYCDKRGYRLEKLDGGAFALVKE